MKKLLIILCAMMLFYGIPGIAGAALINQGGGIILDNTNNLLWQQDLTEFVDMSYEDQLDYIAANFGSGWHMATGSEIDLLSGSYDFADINNYFLPTYTEPDFRVEFNGRIDETAPDGSAYIMTFLRDNDGIGTWEGRSYGYGDWENPTVGAWVAKVVPIPGAVWLLGSGIIGIVGIRRKLKS